MILDFLSCFFVFGKEIRMKFKANRKIMLEHLKSMYKVVPKSTTVQELSGFLIEANENDGYVYMTANNLEAAVQRKFKAEIETAGACIIEAKMLISMLALLKGDDVSFDETKKGITEIKSGNCTYTIKVLDAKIYPRPEMPFPEDTVKITGLKQMYQKTSSTVAKGEASKSLVGIHVDVKDNSVRAVGCDSRGLALCAKDMKCGGDLSFTLHKNVFSYLANAAGDDDLEVGKCGLYIIFMKDGMLFSAKPLMYEYVNVDVMLNSIKRDYLAKVEFDEFKDIVSYIVDIANMGSETSYIKFEFIDDAINISTANDVGNGSTTMPAVVVESSGKKEYYYPAGMLKDIFKTVEGTILLQLDKRGYMMVFDKYNKYMLTPIRDISVQKQAEKFAAKKKPKKAKTENKAA